MITELGKRCKSSRALQIKTSQVPTHAEIRQAMDRLLSNKRFANAPMKRRFIQLICKAYLDGRAEELNEYMIGCEVFGRDNSYSPALDPIVRVGAHELRKKLESYYKDEGKNDEILLDVPVGSYIPVFTRRAQTPEMAEIPKIDPPYPIPINDSNKLRQIIIRIGLCVLVSAMMILVYFNWQLRQQIKKEAAHKKATEVYSKYLGRITQRGESCLTGFE